MSLQNKAVARVVAIVGPTAVGKTAAAIELARLVGGEIVSADSMAVYKGMDIGTAKPTGSERESAVFHLIDVADPGLPFSVGEFQELAHAAIDDILGRGLAAIVVGGSGLYVRAAVDGLDVSLPGADPELRSRLLEEARNAGAQALHARLARMDPDAAARIHPNNVRRVIRAIEICSITGSTVSSAFEQDARRPLKCPDARFFGLTMNRDSLYARIDRRVDAMIEAGLVEEVAGLLKQGVDPALPSMQGLGYKEVAGFLQGKYGRDEAVDLLKKNTRRFAKRQYTWFRADGRVNWIDVERIPRKVSETIKESFR